MRICSFCGRQLPASADTCPACGLTYTEPLLQGNVLSKPTSKDLKRYSDLLGDEDLFRAAVCFKNGIAVKQDAAQAKELFYILAMRGNLDGMFQYAEACLASAPSEADKAVHWLTIAAKSGHVSSRLKLSELGYVEYDYKDCAERNAGCLEARVRNALPFIVTVSADANASRRLGSGFLLDGGIVVTNAHVVGEPSAYVVVRFETGIDFMPYEMKCLDVFKEYDIAVLKFKGLAAEKFSAREALCLRLDEAEFGEEVYTIGNPLGLGLSVSKGVVSCPDRDTSYGAVSEVIQTDITANHGNSGGPLLDCENRVLGLITYVPGASSGGIAMCVPSKYIVQALNKVEI